TGGRLMETSQSVPLDLVQVIQALVVLFIAAPPLVRTLIGLRHIDQPGADARLSRAQRRKAAAATVDSPAGGAAATEPTAASANAAAIGLAGERSAVDPPDRWAPPSGGDTGLAQSPPASQHPADGTDPKEYSR